MKRTIFDILLWFALGSQQDVPNTKSTSYSWGLENLGLGFWSLGLWREASDNGGEEGKKKHTQTGSALDNKQETYFDVAIAPKVIFWGCGYIFWFRHKFSHSLKPQGPSPVHCEWISANGGLVLTVSSFGKELFNTQKYRLKCPTFNGQHMKVFLFL